jgi:hypothetical protein
MHAYGARAVKVTEPSNAACSTRKVEGRRTSRHRPAPQHGTRLREEDVVLSDAHARHGTDTRRRYGDGHRHTADLSAALDLGPESVVIGRPDPLVTRPVPSANKSNLALTGIVRSTARTLISYHRNSSIRHHGCWAYASSPKVL